MRPEQHAQLALLLEVSGTPKPGNVDRCRDYPTLRFEQFLAGAVGALDGLDRAAQSDAIGAAFETAVRGMSEQEGGNTQFGALLLLVPLVRASSLDSLSPDGVTTIVTATSIEDAESFYRAFDHVAVAVDDPPSDIADLDVRRGSAAIPSVRDREVSLYDVMELSADRDGVANEWVTGFSRSFDAADRLRGRDEPLRTRTARVFLELLAEEPDTFIEKQHDAQTAKAATDRANAAIAGDVHPDQLAESFVSAGINPGTTADVIAAGLFIALERGMRV